MNDDNSINKYVYYVKKGEEVNIDGNFKRFFKALGIIDKLEFINAPTKYKEILIPDKSYEISNYYTDHFLGVFNKVKDNLPKYCEENKYKKIFLSRSAFGKSKKIEFGTDMLDNYFKNNGFKILFPEQLSLQELIFYLGNAEEVAVMAGTAQHNLLFVSEKPKIYIIERMPFQNNISLDINKMKNLSVTYIKFLNFS